MTIKQNFEQNGYLHDTHTAVAFYAAEKYVRETSDTTPMIVDSTASPYKFATDVYVSLTGEKIEDALKAPECLSEKTNTEIPYPLKDIAKRKVNFTKVVKPEEMPDAVLDYLK